MTDSKIVSGRKVVTTAGTRVRLSETSINCKKIEFSANDNGDAVVVLGGENVIAAEETRQGMPLFSGDVRTIYIDNVNKVWLDSTEDNKGGTFDVFS